MLRIVVFALAALLLFSLHTPVSADGEIGDLVWKAAAAYNSPTGSEYPVIAFSADGTKLAVPMGFNQVGIAVHSGVGADVRTAVDAYLQGDLPVVDLEGACRH